MGRCTTIKKADDNAPGGFVIVNVEDFDCEVDQEYGVEPIDGPYDGMTKDELGDELNKRDIEFSLTSRKSELIGLLADSDNG